MTPEQARRLFERYGAMLRGHFQLSSGRHSDQYVQKARVLEHPEPTMELAGEIASWYSEIDVVVAPAVGAVVLGFAVALSAGARSIFAEREDGGMRMRRGFTVVPGERALVVEDVITIGTSAKEILQLLGAAGAEALGVAALVDRSATDVGFPLRSVLRVEAASWAAERCPLCRRGVPLDSPGSRFLSTPARKARSGSSG
jgi:orotate phosphoribosyltransferase